MARANADNLRYSVKFTKSLSRTALHRTLAVEKFRANAAQEKVPSGGQLSVDSNQLGKHKQDQLILSMEQDYPDQPSAVHSTSRPMSDITWGSLYRSHFCHVCSAVFMLPRSLKVHMATTHATPICDTETSGIIRKPHNGHGRCLTQGAGDTRETVMTSSGHSAIKLEPPWSMKEEGQDQPSAVYSPVQPSDVYSPVQPSDVYSPVQPSDVYSPVQPSDVYSPVQPSDIYSPVQSSDVYSPVQPMSDNTSGLLLSLNTSHVCQHCSATFVLFSSLELHMATFHGEMLCDLFPMSSAYNGYPVGGHHGSNGGYVNSSQNIVKAMKETVEDTDAADRTEQKKKAKKYVCDLCNKGFTHPSTLKTHKRIHTGERPYQCSRCDANFKNSSSLQKHIKAVHTGIRPYACNVCEKAFCSNGDLKKHKRIHTGEKPYTCDVCWVAFSQKSNLTQHKRIHTGEKPYACEVCGAAFAQISNLKLHKRIHSGEKPHSCTQCGKRFAVSCDLKQHQMTHTGEKPHTCDVCAVAFARAGHLKRHMRVHTGEKPYVCTECGKRFSLSIVLKRHWLIHTGERPHPCPHCPAAFTQASHVKRHVQRLHKYDTASFLCSSWENQC